MRFSETPIDPHTSCPSDASINTLVTAPVPGQTSFQTIQGHGQLCTYEFGKYIEARTLRGLLDLLPLRGVVLRRRQRRLGQRGGGWPPVVADGYPFAARLAGERLQVLLQPVQQAGEITDHLAGRGTVRADRPGRGGGHLPVPLERRGRVAAPAGGTGDRADLAVDVVDGGLYLALTRVQLVGDGVQARDVAADPVPAHPRSYPSRIMLSYSSRALTSERW